MNINNSVWLSIGGNQGDRLVFLQQATDDIRFKVGPIVRKSSIYKTAAWGNTNQDDFYNQALEVLTPLSPNDLLNQLLLIEETLGRKREQAWGPRTIDIDILYIDQQIIDTESLTVPHPRIQDRRFVLVPMVEIAETLIHPVLFKTQRQLLTSCLDELEVIKLP